jgi:hypothetical protein
MIIIVIQPVFQGFAERVRSGESFSFLKELDYTLSSSFSSEEPTTVVVREFFLTSR